MKKSFRVATVFTGVAAVTGGFGPTALAATTHPTVIHPATVENQICGANDGGISHWAHVYYPNDDHPAECFHGAGKQPEKGTIYSICPGNNSVIFWGNGGIGNHFPAGWGRTTIGDWALSAVQILGWSGSAKC